MLREATIDGSTYGLFFQGWALAEREESEVGIAMMQDALMAYQATEARQRLPYFFGLIAEAHGN
jgi:predicted ATPase